MFTYTRAKTVWQFTSKSKGKNLTILGYRSGLKLKVKIAPLMESSLKN